MGLVLVVVGLLGLAVGSFLNVVVWRVPRGESVVRPRSACPRCHAPITARDNVPVLSWVLLRGRCRSCTEPISARYPLVEAGTSILFVMVAWWDQVSPALPALLVLAAVGITLALIDLDTHTLPDVIVLPSIGVGLALLALASAGTGDWGALARGVAGAAILFALYFVLMVVKPGGMGFGDVKLAALLGLYLGWYGWGALAVGAFAAFLLGGLFSIGLVVARRAGRSSGIPFGPWMLVGAAVGLVAGEQLWHGYLSLM